VGPLCPNTHRVASHVRPHPIGAVAARTTEEPKASRRQWRVGVPMADPRGPKGTKDQEGPLRGEAVRQGTLGDEGVANRTIGHRIEHPAQGLGVERAARRRHAARGMRERSQGEAAETSRANRSRLYTTTTLASVALHHRQKREACRAMRKGPAVARRSAHSCEKRGSPLRRLAHAHRDTPSQEPMPKPPRPQFDRMRPLDDGLRARQASTMSTVERLNARTRGARREARATGISVGHQRRGQDVTMVAGSPAATGACVAAVH
jgi:hypothetical protein